MSDVCWHHWRVLGARTIVRRRLAAGWPNISVSRGRHVVCTTCLHLAGVRRTNAGGER